METPNLYNFHDPREFLLAYLSFNKAVNKDFNVMQWARKLGYNSPGYLANVLNGKRKIQKSLVDRIAKNIGWTDKEVGYFILLIKHYYAKTDVEKQLYWQHLLEYLPGNHGNSLALDRFRLIKDWYHIPLLQMLDLKDFHEDAGYLAKQLGSRVAPQAVEMALQRLVRLGLACRDKKTGRLKKSDDRPLFVGAEISDSHIQAYHKKFIEFSLEAIDKRSVSTRDVSGTTLPIRSDKLPELKDLIRDFQRKLHVLASEDADTIYQVNVQGFQLLTEIENKHHA